ncbi:MAG: DNA translocase FtsK [Planctomycetaceae bacterium]
MKNPFAEDRLNSAIDYRPEWDVLSIHQEVSSSLEQLFRELNVSDVPDPERRILVLKAAPGTGKTHLFGRLAHRVTRETLAVFVPQIETVEQPLNHFRWHLVESLFAEDSNGRSPLVLALARLSRESFRDYFRWLPPSVRDAHHQLGERLRDDDLAVLDVISSVKREDPFISTAHLFAGDYAPFAKCPSGVALALSLGWAPERLRNAARKWLRGDTISEELRRQIGLPEDSPQTVSVFQAVAALFNFETPVVLCCDQIEAILRSEQATHAYTNALVLLLQQVPNLQIVVSCLEDRWDKVRAFADASFPARCDEKHLDSLNGQQSVDLLMARIAAWGERHPGDLTWPLDIEAWKTKAEQARPPARVLLNLASAQFCRWRETGDRDARFGPDDVADPEVYFCQAWDSEFNRIRTDKNLSPEHLQESQIYSILREAVKTISDHSLPDYPQVASLKDDAVPGTASAARFGFQAKNGNLGVLLAVTKLENPRSLPAFLNAVFQAAKETHSQRCVILHHGPELPAGAGTLKRIDEAILKGQLQTISLTQDCLQDFERLHCYWKLVRQAEQQNLSCGDKLLEVDDCRSLAVKLGYLDGISLLETCLSALAQPVAPQKSAPAAGAGKQSSNSIAGSATAQSRGDSGHSATPSVGAPTATATLQPAVGESPSANEQPTATGTATVSRNTDRTPDSDCEWCRERLTNVVQQLKALRVRVEEKGFQKGPVFARLMVSPQGDTTINRVRNRAEDLKVRLGLEEVPFVNSHSGAICVDVELPSDQKTIVTLSEALLDPPASADESDPVFPVGQDVAGKNHWADLSNANTCHFLIAGTTGSGKSELLKTIVAALARRLDPTQLQFILVDPKRVTFNFRRNESPFLKWPVANTLEEALPMIHWAFEETERRYELLQKEGVANLAELSRRTIAPPRIVLLCDEFADLMSDPESKDKLERPLKTLSAKSRAAGIHLVLATQRPEKSVVTPLIRTNLPGRIAMKVKSKGDSEMVINQDDACHLLGKGDLLWERGASLLRLQCPLTTQDELEDALRM